MGKQRMHVEYPSKNTVPNVLRGEQEKLKNRTYISSSSRWSDSSAHTRSVTLSDWAHLPLWGCSFISNLAAVWVWADVGYPQLHIPTPCAVPNMCNPVVNHDRDLMVLLPHGTQSWRNSNKSSNWFQIICNSYTKEGIHVPVCQWTFSQELQEQEQAKQFFALDTDLASNYRNWKLQLRTIQHKTELRKKKWSHQTYLRDPESFGCCRSLSAWFNAIRLSPKARAT